MGRSQTVASTAFLWPVGEQKKRHRNVFEVPLRARLFPTGREAGEIYLGSAEASHPGM